MSTNNPALAIALEGIIIGINPVELKGANRFPVRTILLQVGDGERVQVLRLDFAGEKAVEIPDRHQLGDRVKCNINLRGNQWKETAYNTLSCWRVEMLQGAATYSQNQYSNGYGNYSQSTTTSPHASYNESSADGLPF